MDADQHGTETGGMWARGRARRFALVGAVIATFVTTGAFMLVNASSAAPAPVHPFAVATALIEVSNSCLPEPDPPTPVSLTFWGSHVAPNANLFVVDQRGYLGSGFAVTSDANGNFEATATFTPNIDLPPTDFFVVRLNTFTYAGSRQIRFAIAGMPACPTTTPAVAPCQPASAAVPLEADGILSPFSGSLEKSDTKWFLDYPGNGNSPTPFATTFVVNGNISATLPAGAATGNHLITAHVEYQPGVFARDDAWVSWRVAVCPPTTTTTPPATTTTTTTTVPNSPNAQLTVNPAAGPTGSVPSVHGTGFAPGATVVLQWRPGVGSATVVADASGSFTVQMLVMPHDVIGPRQVVAFGYPPSVSANFLAGLDSAGPPNPDPAAMLFRQ